jgi:hypothetical protein
MTVQFGSGHVGSVRGSSLNEMGWLSLETDTYRSDPCQARRVARLRIQTSRWRLRSDTSGGRPQHLAPVQRRRQSQVQHSAGAASPMPSPPSSATGRVRRNVRILRSIWVVPQEPDGAERERSAALERAAIEIRDRRRALGELDNVQTRMTDVLDELALTDLVTTTLAEVGDPARFDCARTWVKHAVLCPLANDSGTFIGRTKISGRGRTAARTAASLAVWGALPHNAVYAALFRQLCKVVTRRVA